MEYNQAVPYALLVLLLWISDVLICFWDAYNKNEDEDEENDHLLRYAINVDHLLEIWWPNSNLSLF